MIKSLIRFQFIPVHEENNVYCKFVIYYDAMSFKSVYNQIPCVI